MKQIPHVTAHEVVWVYKTTNLVITCICISFIANVVIDSVVGFCHPQSEDLGGDPRNATYPDAGQIALKELLFSEL